MQTISGLFLTIFLEKEGAFPEFILGILNIFPDKLVLQVMSLNHSIKSNLTHFVNLGRKGGS